MGDVWFIAAEIVQLSDLTLRATCGREQLQHCASLDRLVGLCQRRQFEFPLPSPFPLYPASGSSGSACSRSRTAPVALNQQIEFMHRSRLAGPARHADARSLLDPDLEREIAPTMAPSAPRWCRRSPCWHPLKKAGPVRAGCTTRNFADRCDSATSHARAEKPLQRHGRRTGVTSLEHGGRARSSDPTQRLSRRQVSLVAGPSRKRSR